MGEEGKASVIKKKLQLQCWSHPRPKDARTSNASVDVIPSQSSFSSTSSWSWLPPCGWSVCTIKTGSTISLKHLLGIIIKTGSTVSRLKHPPGDLSYLEHLSRGQRLRSSKKLIVRGSWNAMESTSMTPVGSTTHWTLDSIGNSGQ